MIRDVPLQGEIPLHPDSLLGRLAVAQGGEQAFIPCQQISGVSRCALESLHDRTNNNVFHLPRVPRKWMVARLVGFGHLFQIL